MRDNPRPQEIYRHFKGGLYQIITLAEHSQTGEMLVIYQALYGEFTVYARELSEFLSETDQTKYPSVLQKYRFERAGQQKTDIKSPEAKPTSNPETEKTESRDSEKKRVGEWQRRDLKDKVQIVELRGANKSKTTESIYDVQRDTDMTAGKADAGRTDIAAEKADAGRTDIAAEKADAGRTDIAAEKAEAERIDTASGKADAGRTETTSEQQINGQKDGENLQTEETINIDPLVMEFLDADSYEERLNILAALHCRITDEMINTMSVAVDVEINEGDIEERYEALKTCLVTLEKYECNRLR